MLNVKEHEYYASSNRGTAEGEFFIVFSTNYKEPMLKERMLLAELLHVDSLFTVQNVCIDIHPFIAFLMFLHRPDTRINVTQTNKFFRTFLSNQFEGNMIPVIPEEEVHDKRQQDQLVLIYYYICHTLSLESPFFPNVFRGADIVGFKYSHHNLVKFGFRTLSFDTMRYRDLLKWVSNRPRAHMLMACFQMACKAGTQIGLPTERIVNEKKIKSFIKYQETEDAKRSLPLIKRAHMLI
jgi:hypothetical protein